MVNIDGTKFTETDAAIRALWRKVFPVLCESLGHPESSEIHADKIAIPTKIISAKETGK